MEEINEEKKTRRQLTEEELKFIFESHFSGKTMKWIAEQLDINPVTVSRHLNNVEDIQQFGKEAEKKKAAALNIIANAAVMAANRTLEIAGLDLTEKNIFAVQNANRDILDRAGIREKEDKDSNIKVEFLGGKTPVIAMPPKEDEVE